MGSVGVYKPALGRRSWVNNRLPRQRYGYGYIYIYIYTTRVKHIMCDQYVYIYRCKVNLYSRNRPNDIPGHAKGIMMSLKYK